MADEPNTSGQLQLPMGAVTKADIGRLLLETESVDNFLQQATIRQPGTSVQLPKTSQIFEEIVSINKLNMLQEIDRKKLYQFLQVISKEAPVLHIGFSTEPSNLFQQKLITWIRQQMHPYLILQIGLQPSIGAGCVVRSTNKFYDFSLRERFKDQRMLLISKLRGVEEPRGEINEPKTKAKTK